MTTTDQISTTFELIDDPAELLDIRKHADHLAEELDGALETLLDICARARGLRFDVARIQKGAEARAAEWAEDSTEDLTDAARQIVWVTSGMSKVAERMFTIADQVHPDLVLDVLYEVVTAQEVQG